MPVTKKIYRLPEVLGMYGFSKPTVYRMMALGRFPKPVKLSLRAVGWTAASLEEFDKSLMPEGV